MQPELEQWRNCCAGSPGQSKDLYRGDTGEMAGRSEVVWSSKSKLEVFESLLWKRKGMIYSVLWKG